MRRIRTALLRMRTAQHGTKTLTQGYSLEKQIGEGTYGEVYLGSDKTDQTRGALKEIKMQTERDGFPITAIREIKLLSTMSHINVINLREVVRSESEC
jgi:serine/threonine protein kinase